MIVSLKIDVFIDIRALDRQTALSYALRMGDAFCDVLDDERVVCPAFSRATILGIKNDD